MSRNKLERKFYSMHDQSSVYILANKKNGTLYIGVTSNLVQRIWQHKEDLQTGFTKTYQVNKLVYFELHQDIMLAITREKNEISSRYSHKRVDLKFFGLMSKR
ncbi:MAG: GIY-YIG nuclease family protein [Enterobacterales bacterium]|nr:GIY-YIG nuclease family protein [Enterobacterales bacterium]